MITMEELKDRVGAIGWVRPNRDSMTATIAVKVVGVNVSYGKKLYVVEPVAGTGSWQVGFEHVEFGDTD